MYFWTGPVLIFIYLTIIYSFRYFIRFSEYTDFILCPDCSATDLPHSIFDYIVVGCGSAGAIVAKRLSEDKNMKVLILEAGNYGNKLLNIPSLGILLQNTIFDWQYTTTPQSTSCLALNNNVSLWPMGKIVGGTGMLNNMIYVRGHPEDFVEWFKDKENYDYEDDILPYFKKLESYREVDSRNPVHVQDLGFTSILPDYFLPAAESLGYTINGSVIDCEKGFGLPKVNMHNGERWTPSHYIYSNQNPNLILRTNRTVHKILFHDNFEAYGVQYLYLNKIYTVRASKGIVLSAGTVGSPKILMLSGVGPKHHLNKLDIEAKLDLPVGYNLQDHLTTGFDLILLNQSLKIGIEQMLSPFSIIDYFLKGQGPWTTAGCESMAYFDTKQDKKEIRPDLQFMVMPLGITEDQGYYLRHLIGISDFVWDNYFALLNGTTAMTILPVLLHPKSTGILKLKDSNIDSQPVIDPKYLSESEDIAVLIKGIEIIKKIVNTESMQKLGAKFNTIVFPGCEQFDFDSNSYWECYLRHMTITSYHPVGTCKMGVENDKTSVINYNFQVKGTNNLFVVDGSVMPTLTSGNINGAIMMLAEMASDLIKYKNFLDNVQCHILELFIKSTLCSYF